MKHISHFVLPGAHRLKTSGGKDHLAFKNPAGDIVLVLINNDEQEKEIRIAVHTKTVTMKLKAKSINSIVLN